MLLTIPSLTILALSVLFLIVNIALQQMSAHSALETSPSKLIPPPMPLVAFVLPAMSLIVLLILAAALLDKSTTDLYVCAQQLIVLTALVMEHVQHAILDLFSVAQFVSINALLLIV